MRKTQCIFTKLTNSFLMQTSLSLNAPYRGSVCLTTDYVRIYFALNIMPDHQGSQVQG